MTRKLILLLFSLLLILSGCANTKQELKDDSKESVCEAAEKRGEDLNKNGCMYLNLENAQKVVFYLPDGSLPITTNIEFKENTEEDYVDWVHVVPINSFANKEDINVDYFIDVLKNLLFEEDVEFTYEVEPRFNSVSVLISSDMIYDFATSRGAIDEEKEMDTYGVAQVLMHSIGATLYANFPDIPSVTFTMLGLEEITPIEDGEYIDKATLLPKFFGSPANYIGNQSYQDVKNNLENQGIKFDNYAESHHLEMINGFVLDSMSN